jgi:outer membrane protein W
MSPLSLLTLVLLASSLVAVPASAQEVSAQSGGAFQSSVATPRPGAVELTVGANYLQGNGALTGSNATAFDNTGREGVGIDLSAGLRFTPRLSGAVYGSLGHFNAASGTLGSSSWNTSLGVQGQFHFAPSDRLDPWISVGTGWTANFQSAAGGTNARHGFELARVQMGIDYRVNSQLSISPVVGAAVSTLLTESLATGGGFHSVADTRIHAAVFGGVAGRFDLGGAAPVLVASR